MKVWIYKSDLVKDVFTYNKEISTVNEKRNVLYATLLRFPKGLLIIDLFTYDLFSL